MAATYNKVCLHNPPSPDEDPYFRIYDNRIEEEDTEGNEILGRWNIPIKARFAIDKYNAPIKVLPSGELELGYCRDPRLEILTVEQISVKIQQEQEEARKWLQGVVAEINDPLINEAGIIIPDNLQRPPRMWATAEVAEIIAGQSQQAEITLLVDYLTEEITEVDIEDYEFQRGVY